MKQSGLWRVLGQEGQGWSPAQAQVLLPPNYQEGVVRVGSVWLCGPIQVIPDRDSTRIPTFLWELQTHANN